MMKIYTVKDEASQTFLKPFCFPTDRDAIEGFKNVCQDETTQYAKYPADYNLISIASFDEQSGLLEVSDQKTIARAINMVGQSKMISLEDICSVMKSIELHKEEEHLFELLAEKLGVKYE